MSGPFWRDCAGKSRAGGLRCGPGKRSGRLRFGLIETGDIARPGAVDVLADGWTRPGMTVLPSSARDAIADKCSALRLLCRYLAGETGMKKWAWSYWLRRSPQPGSGGHRDLAK